MNNLIFRVLSQSRSSLWKPCLIAYLTWLILAGCTAGGVPGSRYPAETAEPAPSVLLLSSYLAGDQLAEQLKRNGYIMEHSIAAASFVELDSLTQSSSFGKTVSQQIITKLFQNGFSCLELRIRENTIFVKSGKGEFVLSREMELIRNKHDIEAFLVGTYSVAHRDVHVTARVVCAKAHVIIASYDYVVRITPAIDRMLHGNL